MMKIKKKATCLGKYCVAVVMFLLLFYPMVVKAETEEKIVSGFTFTLKDDGTLTIDGNGKLTKEIVDESGFFGAYDYGIKNIIIEESVTSIGESAFNWKDYFQSVRIEGDMETIGEFAFYACSKLEKVYINGEIGAIGNCAFHSSSLKTVYINGNIDTIGDGAFSGDASLQLTVNGNIKRIGAAAFSTHDLFNKKYLITIKGSIQYIGDSAFYNCKKVEVKKGITKSVGDSAFWGSGITTIDLKDSVTKIGEFAFQDCDKLKKITIPKGVKKLSRGCFGWCDSLEKVVIPNTVKEIDSAFYNCKKLKSITLPEGLTTIDGFGNLDSLKEITIPRKVKIIKSQAFWYDESLKKITLPKSLKQIESEAFKRTGITDIYYEGSSSDWKKVKIQTWDGNGGKDFDFSKVKMHYLSGYQKGITLSKKQIELSYQPLQSKSLGFNLSKYISAKSDVTCKKVSGDSRISVYGDGLVMVSKKISKGTYKIKVNLSNKEAKETVEITIKVK